MHGAECGIADACRSLASRKTRRIPIGRRRRSKEMAMLCCPSDACRPCGLGGCSKLHRRFSRGIACHLRRYRDAGGVVKMIVLRAELVPRRRPCGCCCFARICSLLVRTNGSKARPWSPARRKEGRAPTSDTKRQGGRRSWLTRSDCSRTSLACGQRSASISETQTSESVPEMHLRSKFRIENERRMRKRAGKEDRMHMLPAAS